MCIYKLYFAILEIDIHTYLLHYVADLSWPKKKKENKAMTSLVTSISSREIQCYLSFSVS